MGNKQIITGQENEIRVNNEEVIPLDLPYIVAANSETGEPTAYFSLSDQKRKTWFFLDLETADTWDPAKDTQLQELIAQRHQFEPGSDNYNYYQKQIDELYKQHPAFIRKK